MSEDTKTEIVAEESAPTPEAVPLTAEEPAPQATSEETAPAAAAPAPAERAASEEPAPPPPADDANALATKKTKKTTEAAGDEARKRAEEKARQARVAPLYRAFRAGRTISGRVEAVIKGGYEVRLGKNRAFCPHSQIDSARVDDPESFVGRSLPFRITQLRRGGSDVVVSRRVLIEEERREEAAAVRATLIEGAVMLGRVSGLAKFGAFVDLGAGVNGLVHVTELSHGRVGRIDQVVKVGDPVRVKILKLEGDNQRISLSIRQASEDPWKDVDSSFRAGETYPGKVLRLADFGAFIELAPGVEALAPAGEFPPSAGGWAEGLEVGCERPWIVLRVDAGQRRISVTPPGDAEETAPEVVAGATARGKVQRIERYGVFVWLAPGKVGLIPNALTGTPPGTDLTRRFQIADDLEVDVVEIDEAGRIRLAVKGAAAAAARRRSERTPRGERPRRRRERAPEAPPVSDSNEGFGSLLADKLKDALG